MASWYEWAATWVRYCFGIQPNIAELREIIIDGDADRLQRLIDQGYNVCVHYDEANGGGSSLTLAAAHGHCNIINMLLAANRFSDYQFAIYTDGRYTALLEAIRGGHTNAVDLFLDRGVAIYSQVVRTAIDANQFDILLLLFDRQNGYNVALPIVNSGNLELVKQFVNARPDIVHYRAADGSSALHWAAERGLTDIAIFLIDRGVDVNATDNMLQTPITLACRHSPNLHTVIMLHKRGATLNPVSLHDAMTNLETPEIVEYLISIGFDVNAHHLALGTPLDCGFLALRAKNYEITSFGPIGSKNGLFEAWTVDNVDDLKCLSALITAGADVDQFITWRNFVAIGYNAGTIKSTVQTYRDFFDKHCPEVFGGGSSTKAAKR